MKHAMTGAVARDHLDRLPDELVRRVLEIAITVASSGGIVDTELLKRLVMDAEAAAESRGQRVFVSERCGPDDDYEDLTDAMDREYIVLNHKKSAVFGIFAEEEDAELFAEAYNARLDSGNDILKE